METNDANKGQRKLYLLLRFIGHAPFCVRTGLKSFIIYPEIWYVLALWTSVVKLRQLLCLMHASCSVLLTQYCAGGKIETNEMGRACGAYGGG